MASRRFNMGQCNGKAAVCDDVSEPDGLTPEDKKIVDETVAKLKYGD